MQLFEKTVGLNSTIITEVTSSDGAVSLRQEEGVCKPNSYF